MLGLIGLQPLIHLANTRRILNYFSGKDVDCFDPSKSENGYPYDAIIVLGGGFGINDEGLPEPAELHQLRLAAGAISYIRGLAPKIVLLDGKIDSGIDPNLDLKFLQDAVYELSLHKLTLPDTDVIVENNSVNTSSNLREYATISETQGYQSALMITNYWHLERAELLSCNFPVNVFPRSAEDIIIEFDPTLKPVIQSIYDSLDMGDHLLKEDLGVLEQLFDPQGKLPALIKEVTFSQ